MMRYPTLLGSTSLSAMPLANRVVMAPMTRNRAGPAGVPTALNALYYSQRAGAGLIVAESTQVCATGVSYARTPGLHSDPQTLGWRRITEAVHASGGRIFAQLCHGGRISHPDLLPVGELPVSSSAQRPRGYLHTGEQRRRMPTPRPLAEAEIAGVVDAFAAAGRNALRAGFDGVEVHAANGYLIDQFLRDGVNDRVDRYGGAPANRARLLMEVVEALSTVWGPGRIGVRISPRVEYNSMIDSDPAETFGYVAARLHEAAIAYLHVIEPIDPHHYMASRKGPPLAPMLRQRFGRTLILNGGYDAATAERTLDAGEADLISFGEPFIANPDLPQRFSTGAPLSLPEREQFYGPDEAGYTTYSAAGSGPEDTFTRAVPVHHGSSRR